MLIGCMPEKLVTVKLGGSALESERTLEQLADDILGLSELRMGFVVVHGAGREITREMEALGVRPVKVAGLRVTDDATMEVVERVMRRVNDHICRVFRERGLAAERVIGADGLLSCRKRQDSNLGNDAPSSGVDLGRVGEVDQVFPDLLSDILRRGGVPVVAPYGLGPDGRTLNVNADTAAGSIAGACCDEFVLLTDVEGVLVTTDCELKVAKAVTVSEVRRLIDAQVIRDGMLPKVQACIHALDRGVKIARIVSGLSDHPLQAALLSGSVGTQILP